jgi:hypothetical protein
MSIPDEVLVRSSGWMQVYRVRGDFLGASIRKGGDKYVENADICLLAKTH